MSQPLPPGQPPIDPRGAFAPPPPPGGVQGQGFAAPPGRPPAGWTPGGGYPAGGFPPGSAPPAGFPPAGFPPAGFGGGPFPPPMPPYPPRRRGGGRRILFALVLLLLIGSVLINLALMAGVAGSLTKQTTILEGAMDQKVAVIPVEGIITDETAAQFDRFLTQAEKDANVKAVVLAIDTPGGSATSSDTMYHRVEVFRKHTEDAGRKIPIVVSMGGMATSGGYYVACGGDYLFCRHATMTGNIGVIMPRFNVSKLFDKWGIDETTIVATGGIYKDAGSMFKPESDFDRTYLQGLIDATFDQFKQVVLTGRKGKLVGTAPYADIFNGKVFMGDEALKTGLVDAIGYADDAYTYAATAAGLTKPLVVKYQDNSNFLKLLTSQSNVPAPQGNAGPVTIDGVSIDLRQIGELLSPRPLYLWSGQ